MLFEVSSVTGLGYNGITINLRNKNGKTPVPCVYALEGDRLRLALPASGKDGFIRPETLDSTKTKALISSPTCSSARRRSPAR